MSARATMGEPRPMSREEVAAEIGTSVEKVREIEYRAVRKFVRAARAYGLIDRLPREDEVRSWDWASRPPRDRHDGDDDASREERHPSPAGDTNGTDHPYHPLPLEDGGEDLFAAHRSSRGSEEALSEEFVDVSHPPSTRALEQGQTIVVSRASSSRLSAVEAARSAHGRADVSLPCADDRHLSGGRVALAQ